MGNGNFASIHIVPLHRVLNDLSPKLMLQVERHLESLRVAILSNLRDLGAGGHVDIVDLVFNYQIWEVHVNLRYNLLSLEVVDCEPKALTLEVAI